MFLHSVHAFILGGGVYPLDANLCKCYNIHVLKLFKQTRTLKGEYYNAKIFL